MTSGKRSLSSERIQTVAQIPTPTTQKQLRAIVVLCGYCRLWILGHGEIAKPLYPALRGGTNTDPLPWVREQRQPLGN